MNTTQSLERRVDDLERSNRWLKVSLVVLSLGAGLVAASSVVTAQDRSPLRVRGLIVEDAAGNARIVVGRMDEHAASTRGYGVRINDPYGAERFGVSLNEAGSMGMGFDAPPGAGDDRNRERINIVADAQGGAYLALKDRRTYVIGRLYLDADNRGWLQFSDFSTKPAVIRRWGLAGEETQTVDQ